MNWYREKFDFGNRNTAVTACKTVKPFGFALEDFCRDVIPEVRLMNLSCFKGIRPASISSGSEKRVTKNPTISRPRGSRAGDRRRPRIHPRTILRNRDGLRTRASRAYEVPNPGSRTSSILVVIFRSTIGFPPIAPGPP
jgi:hypothetical protein